MFIPPSWARGAARCAGAWCLVITEGKIATPNVIGILSAGNRENEKDPHGLSSSDRRYFFTDAFRRSTLFRPQGTDRWPGGTRDKNPPVRRLQ